MPDAKTKVIIEIQAQVKQLQKDLGKVKDNFKDLKGTIEKSMGGAETKKLVAAIKELTKVQKEAASKFKQGEKEKQTAAKKTSDELKNQKKEIKETKSLLDKLGPVGRFAGGLGGGLGLSGAGGLMGQKATAKSVGGLLGRGMSTIGGGALQFLISGLSGAYQQHLAVGQARGGLVGMGTPGQMGAGLRAAGGVGGAALGYGPTATAMQARGIGRATGNIGAVFRAQQLGRAYGMDVGEVGGYMGMMRQAGFGFGGQARGPGGSMQQVGRQGSRELTKIMEAGLVSGLEKARLPEFLQGVSNITQDVGGRVSGKVNVRDIAAFQALLGSTGKAGFQGARGARVAAQLGQAITRPGGGEAGQAMMLQALGFGKPGGQRTYYEAMKMQQQGMQRPESVIDMFSEVYRQLGAEGQGGTAGVQQEANLALSEMTGLSLQQVEDLGDIINSGEMTTDKLGEIKEILKQAEDPQKQALAAMKEGFGGTVAYLAGIESKQAVIGAKHSKMFENLQKLQLKLLEGMAEWLPKIWGVLSDTFRTTMDFWEPIFSKLAGKDPDAKFKARLSSLRQEYAQIDPKYAGTPKERIEALRQRKEALLGGIADVRQSLAEGNLAERLGGFTGTRSRMVRGEVASRQKQAGQTQAEIDLMNRVMQAGGPFLANMDLRDIISGAGAGGLGQAFTAARHGGEVDPEVVRKGLSKVRKYGMGRGPSIEAGFSEEDIEAQGAAYRKRGRKTNVSMNAGDVRSNQGSKQGSTTSRPVVSR
jgi:hypothetical protein